jgi:SRSO17 transposase
LAPAGHSRTQPWDADALRDVVRDHALEALSEPDAVLVTGGTGFLKQGKPPCGVGRQYTGYAGKATNCQIGVFASNNLFRGAQRPA